ncbi:MAG: translation elongation factor-like protein [bacterium]
MEKEIGSVSHYFGHVSVAAINLTDELKVGDKIHITGHSEDFMQVVSSLQIEHSKVAVAKPGDDIGVQVQQKVHPGDKVYKVTE